MDQLVIQGGTTLTGEIQVSGSKNAVLPMLCGALLADTPSVFTNVPRLRDVHMLLSILENMGAKAGFTAPGTVEVDPRGLKHCEAPYEFVKQMRASICLLGALIGRYGEAHVSLPGGCVIGPRPVDMHLKGLRQMGVDIQIEHGNILATGKPQGGTIFLGGRFGSSVTATANCLMAAVLANGTTFIESVAMEPEITDLARYLSAMGAKISGIGSHILQVEGVAHLQGVTYEIIPDRIEAGTFLLAGAMTGGDLFVRGAKAHHLHAVLDKLMEAGITLEEDASGLRVRREQVLQPLEIITHPYPGFPTDLQAQMMALLSTCGGISVITEKIYPERFMHIAELNRMGASISLEGPTAVIKGVKELSGAPVMASDLRASAALLLAALVAEGESVIDRVYHIDRGYEKIEEKLSSCGASIQRMNPNRE